jgi:hypothetical protein
LAYTTTTETKSAPPKSHKPQLPPFKYDSQGRKVWVVYLPNYRPGEPLD